MNLPTLITTRDAARRLGRSVPTVTRLVRSGELVPVAKAPGRAGAFLFDPADVDALAVRRAS